MSSNIQTSSMFNSSLCTDWRSSSSKHGRLVKSFSGTTLSRLRSSAVKISSSNIWRQQEFITAGLPDSHLGWDHCHLVRLFWMKLVYHAPRSRRCTKTVLLLLCYTIDENDMIISTASRSKSLVTAAWNSKQWAGQTIYLNLV